MSLNFHVGQKVVCVDVFWSGGRSSDAGLPCPLELRRVYTIKAIMVQRSIYRGCTSTGPTLILDEVSHPGGPQRGFNPARFRPIVQRQTDISIFKAMLNPSKQKVRA